METIDLPRHQLIKSLMAQPTEKVADTAIKVWEQMAIQIILIVGEDGFNALYARSLFLAQSTFPRSQPVHWPRNLITALQGSKRAWKRKIPRKPAKPPLCC